MAGLNLYAYCANNPVVYYDLSGNLTVIYNEKGEPIETPPAGQVGNVDGKNATSNLLPREGDIGTYKELLDASEVGDNITPHHMPSYEYMSQYGVDKKEGLCMNMEMPSPRTGGRHR